MSSGRGIGPGLLLAILAVAVGIPAGAFIFFTSGGSSQASVAGEPTIVAKAHDPDGDGQAGWIRLVLLEDPERTYTPSALHLEIETPNGVTLVDHDDPLPYVRDTLVCTEPAAQRGVREAERACRTDSDGLGGVSWYDAGEEWQDGESLYIPCQAGAGPAGDADDGHHRVRVSVHSVLVLDQRVGCDQAAPLGLARGGDLADG